MFARGRCRISMYGTVTVVGCGDVDAATFRRLSGARPRRLLGSCRLLIRSCTVQELVSVGFLSKSKLLWQRQEVGKRLAIMCEADDNHRKHGCGVLPTTVVNRIEVFVFVFLLPCTGGIPREFGGSKSTGPRESTTLCAWSCRPRAGHLTSDDEGFADCLAPSQCPAGTRTIDVAA